MIVGYRCYLRDRENGKYMSLYEVKVTDDIVEAAHELMCKLTDEAFVCFRVALVGITDYSIEPYRHIIEGR